MAFAFSAMTRVFEKKSTEKIVTRLDLTLSQITSLKNVRDYQNLHDDFCQWFAKSVRTAERNKKDRTVKYSTSASYGQGAKVLDVALKVLVYYCQLPDPETAKRTIKWLNAAIDTKMMRHLKSIPNAEAPSIIATSIEDVTERTYHRLQELVRDDIEHNFQSSILPVEWDDIIWRKLNNKGKRNQE